MLRAGALLTFAVLALAGCSNEPGAPTPEATEVPSSLAQAA